MSAISGSYALVVRAKWIGLRRPVLILIEEIPNDISPKAIYAELGRRLIVGSGRVRLAWRDLEAGMHFPVLVCAKDVQRWPKWTGKRVCG